MKLTGPDGQTDRRTDGKDHVLTLSFDISNPAHSNNKFLIQLRVLDLRMISCLELVLTCVDNPLYWIVRVLARGVIMALTLIKYEMGESFQ